MNDLISRKAALEKNEMLYRDARDDTSYMIIGYNHALSDMKAIIKSLPSAQPEIVWCKDCEHWYTGEDDQYGYCRNHDFWTSDIWFCADGERRDG